MGLPPQGPGAIRYSFRIWAERSTVKGECSPFCGSVLPAAPMGPQVSTQPLSAPSVSPVPPPQPTSRHRGAGGGGAPHAALVVDLLFFAKALLTMEEGNVLALPLVPASSRISLLPNCFYHSLSNRDGEGQPVPPLALAQIHFIKMLHWVPERLRDNC